MQFLRVVIAVFLLLTSPALADSVDGRSTRAVSRKWWKFEDGVISG